MTKPLEKNLTFNYSSDELFLLKDIYLSRFESEKDSGDDDLWISERALNEIGVEGFIDWLMEDDRTKLLK